MNISTIFSGLTRTFYKTGFTFKKHSPEILIVGGTATAITGMIMACNASRKLDKVLEENHEEIADARNTVTETGEPDKHAVAKAYLHSGARLAKLYGPAISVTAAGFGCIFTSHNIIRTRNIALAAAYASVDKSFKNYRKRLVERFGEELDKELRYDVRTEEVTEEIIDEKGQKQTVTHKVPKAGPNDPSEFSKCYDTGCIGWTKDPESNRKFLLIQQNVANERLQRRGYLFLNEVYDMLGFQHTSAGQIVGWLYRPNDPDYDGDGYVSFGIYDINSQANKDFVNGLERSIWLDFNVDGPIYHMINDLK